MSFLSTPRRVPRSQNLISLNFSAEDIAAIDSALSTLEEKFSQLIELSVEQRRTLAKMGEKTEGVCRQTLIALKETMAARFTGRHATAKRPPA